MLRTSSAFLIVLISTSAFAGDLDCSIAERRDKFEPGLVTYVGAEIVIWGEKFSDEYCFLKLYRVVEDGVPGSDYTWNFYYAGEDWKFIKGIKLLLDGKIVTIEDPDPTRTVGESGFVFEAISCPITDRTCQSINRAKSVSVRVVTTHGASLDHDFDSAELECIRQFWSKTRRKLP